MTTQIKIGIIDPQEVVREGLSVLLNSYEDLCVIGKGKDLYSARHLCFMYNPDILIIDFFCEDLISIEPLKQLQTEFPNVRLFILTNQCNKQIIDESLKLGILAYWLKNVSLGDLTKALRLVRKNQHSLAPEVLLTLLKSSYKTSVESYNLTNREQEVLSYLTQGMSNLEIADVLFISSSTVKNHVSSILSKMRVSNRVEAVALAFKNDLVEQLAVTA
ncbi:MAG: response regulator transcription factor [Phototrophicaceae bacterium]